MIQWYFADRDLCLQLHDEAFCRLFAGKTDCCVCRRSPPQAGCAAGRPHRCGGCADARRNGGPRRGRAQGIVRGEGAFEVDSKCEVWVLMGGRAQQERVPAIEATFRAAWAAWKPIGNGEGAVRLQRPRAEPTLVRLSPALGHCSCAHTVFSSALPPPCACRWRRRVPPMRARTSPTWSRPRLRSRSARWRRRRRTRRQRRQRTSSSRDQLSVDLQG